MWKVVRSMHQLWEQHQHLNDEDFLNYQYNPIKYIKKKKE